MIDRAVVTTDVSLPSRYRAQRVLGSGGMATVYLADDLIAGHPVAVKVLKPALASAVATDRFLREIELVRHLRQANILPVLDAGEAEGVPYYVMPWVDGESLRRRLDRERHLEIEEAVRITRALANALDAAHAKGIIHRDVKPENILLTGDQVFLADFGIARAISQAAGDRLTDSGLAIGTPGYMSPEQASGEREVDARSDIYSLGCVAYEMLAGEAPYTGPLAQAVVAKQLSLPVPSLTVVRDTISDGVDDVVRRALSKVPADRYQKAGSFSDAFEAASHARAGVVQRLTRRARRHAVRIGVGLVGIAAVAVGGRTALENARIARERLTPADTLRYAVFPFAHRGVSDSVAADDERAVRDALVRWTGIEVVDEGGVRDAFTGKRAGSLTGGEAAALARTLRSGRYFRGEVSSGPSRRELRLRLFDAFAADSLLAEATASLVADASQPDTVLRTVVDSLLLRDLAVGEPIARGTRSLPARQAYGRGQRAFDAWDLAGADAAFDTAARMDRGYAQAHLWLALARLWAGAQPPRYAISADQAVLGSDRLSERERALARAVQAQARGELQLACPVWRSLAKRDSLDALAWYGSAHCLTSDDVVVRDPASPSGWSFRTSYSRALRDYETAFRLHPPMLASLGSNVFEALGRLFKTGTTLLRQGRAISPDGQRFSSSMEWSHDSLAFVPYPVAREGSLHLDRRLDAMNEAVRH